MISVLLDVQANLAETSPFLSAQMVLMSTFFQMFIVLGMYIFGAKIVGEKLANLMILTTFHNVSHMSRVSRVITTLTIL